MPQVELTNTDVSMEMDDESEYTGLKGNTNGYTGLQKESEIYEEIQDSDLEKQDDSGYSLPDIQYEGSVEIVEYSESLKSTSEKCTNQAVSKATEGESQSQYDGCVDMKDYTDAMLSPSEITTSQTVSVEKNEFGCGYVGMVEYSDSIPTPSERSSSYSISKRTEEEFECNHISDDYKDIAENETEKSQNDGHIEIIDDPSSEIYEEIQDSDLEKWNGSGYSLPDIQYEGSVEIVEYSESLKSTSEKFTNQAVSKATEGESQSQYDGCVDMKDYTDAMLSPSEIPTSQTVSVEKNEFGCGYVGMVEYSDSIPTPSERSSSYSISKRTEEEFECNHISDDYEDIAENETEKSQNDGHIEIIDDPSSEIYEEIQDSDLEKWNGSGYSLPDIQYEGSVEIVEYSESLKSTSEKFTNQAVSKATEGESQSQYDGCVDMKDYTDSMLRPTEIPTSQTVSVEKNEFGCGHLQNFIEGYVGMMEYSDSIPTPSERSSSYSVSKTAEEESEYDHISDDYEDIAENETEKSQNDGHIEIIDNPSSERLTKKQFIWRQQMMDILMLQVCLPLTDSLTKQFQQFLKRMKMMDILMLQMTLLIKSMSTQFL